MGAGDSRDEGHDEGSTVQIADILTDTEIKIIDENDEVVDVIPGVMMRFS